MSNRWKIFWVASLSLVIFFQACGMHSWEELLVSTADEKKMGREFDSLVKIRHPDVMKSSESVFSASSAAETDLWNYYQARGKDVVSKIKKADLDALIPSDNLCGPSKAKCTKDNFFEFKIIKSTTVNAFAVPGGYVYFYTAIMKQFKSESELMSVMGHEIGHVVLHHSRDAIVKEVGANAIIDLLLGDGMGAKLASLGGSFWLSSNSRENEAQSDSMAFEFTNAIGISSAGLSDFFNRGLAKDANGKCKDETISLESVFSTHPPSCDRVKANDKRIADAHQSFQKDKNTSPQKFTDIVSAAGL